MPVYCKCCHTAIATHHIGWGLQFTFAAVMLGRYSINRFDLHACTCNSWHKFLWVV